MFHLLLLLFLLPQIISWDVDYVDPIEVIFHDRNPEPDRDTYIWNPFLGHCGPNATSVRCGGVCPETCTHKSRKCLPHCGVPCVCRKGFVFSEPLLKCIRRRDCPQDVQQQLVDFYRVFQ